MRNKLRIESKHKSGALRIGSGWHVQITILIDKCFDHNLSFGTIALSSVDVGLLFYFDQ